MITVPNLKLWVDNILSFSFLCAAVSSEVSIEPLMLNGVSVNFTAWFMIIIDDTNDQVPKLLYRNAGPCLDNDRPHVRETTLGTRSISPDSQRLASIAQTLLGQP